MVDRNPFHYVDKFNHMFGNSLESGLEFLGLSDPAVDPDGVREIAKMWRHLATGLDDAAEAARTSLAEVRWEGKASKAFSTRSKAARKQATEMAHSLREGAKSQPARHRTAPATPSPMTRNYASSESPTRRVSAGVTSTTPQGA